MEVREPVYSFEIARRSVARAAYHLGIDSMSEGSLDVLADVVLNYLNRVGRTMSHLVESSGRTSAHVNILDALQACELVASPAVERMHVREKADEADLFAGTGAGTSNTTRSQMSSGWEGMAAFLFGPKWLAAKSDEHEALAPRQLEESIGGAGGKVGPSATGSTKKKKIGWDAPYLDEVAPFPLASEKCANPHPLPPYVGLSLHRVQEDTVEKEEEAKREEAELDQIPDDKFTNSWGGLLKRNFESIEESKQRNQQNSQDVIMTDAEGATEPPKKKVKIADSTSHPAVNTLEGEADELHSSEEIRRNLHLPSFYPTPPVRKSLKVDQRRTVVDMQPVVQVEQEVNGPQSVRSSLVQLGNYWGSGWDNVEKADEATLAVPLGRNPAAVSSSNLVIPLARASGSRVSRILEGSMDAAAMQ